MNESISDVLVDTYRDILRVKAAVADAKPGTRGIVGKGTPGSRLKSRNGDGGALRAFARRHAALDGSPFSGDAKAWLASKGVRS